MGIEIEYPLGYASSGDILFRDTGSPVRRTGAFHYKKSTECN